MNLNSQLGIQFFFSTNSVYLSNLQGPKPEVKEMTKQQKKEHDDEIMRAKQGARFLFRASMIQIAHDHKHARGAARPALQSFQIQQIPDTVLIVLHVHFLSQLLPMQKRPEHLCQECNEKCNELFILM